MFSWSLLVFQFAVLTVALAASDQNPQAPESQCKIPDQMHRLPKNESFDYNHYFKLCLDVQTEPNTWEVQNKICWDRQGVLEVPQNLDQNSAIYNLAFMLYSELELPNTQVWLGARWSDAYNAIVTSTNDSLPAAMLNNWESPDRGGDGKGKCVALNLWADDFNNEERWSKVDCTTKLPAVCFELPGNTTHPTPPTVVSTTPMPTTTTTTTPSPSTISTVCPPTSCPCKEVPLCAKSPRCEPDACLIGDECLSVVSGPFNYTDGYHACNSASRPARKLYYPALTEAKNLFRFAATVGSTCSQVTVSANPPYFEAVWLGLVYQPNNPQPVYYAPDFAYSADTLYVAFFTQTACWSEKDGEPLMLKTNPDKYAMYAACVETARNITSTTVTTTPTTTTAAPK